MAGILSEPPTEAMISAYTLLRCDIGHTREIANVRTIPKGFFS